MRLTNDQISTILKTLDTHFTDYDVFLHGSRLDDTKKGGDIDIFLVIDDSEGKKIEIDYKIKSELSLKLREQKVDLIILTKSESIKNEFFNNSNKKSLKEN